MLLAAADQSFWQEHGDEISAAITLAVAILIAIIVDRLLIGRAVQATTRLDTGELSREARTRLRLIRRLLFLAIILIGVALALSQFTSIKRFATGVLASTAVLGIIIGFAGAPGDRQPRLGRADRDHAADPDRRPGLDRR